MKLEDIIKKSTKKELLYVVEFLNDIERDNKETNNSVKIFCNFLSRDQNILFSFRGVSVFEMKLFNNPKSKIIIEQSEHHMIYHNLFNYSISKYNDFELGFPIDPITFEIIEDEFVIIDGRFYLPSTVKSLVVEETPKNPFTREIITDEEVLNLEYDSSIKDLNSIMNPDNDIPVRRQR